MTGIRPQKVRLHQRSKYLELVYDGQEYQLDAEFLRVHSPSAEVRGHGKPVLQHGKKHVGITQLEPVGNYGLKILFSDDHDTGIYAWSYLFELCTTKDSLWEKYLEALHRAAESREPGVSVVKLK